MSEEKIISIVLFLLVTPSTSIFYSPSNKENFLALNTYIVKMTTKSDSENCSSETHQSAISFTKSNKGKPIIIHENHLFKCNKTTASKKYWLCVEKECGVYIHISVTNELICITGGHNHSVNPDQLATKLLRDKMKERILAETTSITKIYDEEIVKANLCKGATAIMPTIVEYRMRHSTH
jgi:hypothetical protein